MGEEVTNDIEYVYFYVDFTTLAIVLRGVIHFMRESLCMCVYVNAQNIHIILFIEHILNVWRVLPNP